MPACWSRFRAAINCLRDGPMLVVRKTFPAGVLACPGGRRHRYPTLCRGAICLAFLSTDPPPRFDFLGLRVSPIVKAEGRFAMPDQPRLQPFWIVVRPTM